jgi:two-component system, chemotaxis family, sensor kinase CheA
MIEPTREYEPEKVLAMEYADAGLIAEFVVESQEGLADIEQQMLAIEAGGEDVEIELVNAVFRTMHTIKGTAGFLGLDCIGTLAHSLEELLNDLRNREITTSSELITTILTAADCMRGLIEEVETSNEVDISEHVARLQQYRPQAQPATNGQPPAPGDDAAQTRGRSDCKPGILSPNENAAPPEHPGPPSSEPADQARAKKTTAPGGDTTVRVDVGLLDKLMIRVGELVLARNQIVQYTNRHDDASFISTAQRLNLITTELQESVMKTRMQPIGNVWAKFPRVVRDLAAQLGKQVRIDMEGTETELDKTIVEAIKDPLTHLVRNAIDHGLESPADRLAAGKSAEGRLLLRAYHEGGQVNIEITDDGAGLNLERIRSRAVERGLMTADQAARLSDREAAQLIFAPGFSTAEQVTSVSGRGVGMDVVKTNIERISGTIDLQCHSGAGTTVQIKIPLTLAIIPALIVTNDGDRYAIPQVSLLELVRLDGEDAKRGIEYVHGAPVYRLRGKLLPLVYLSERLGHSKSPDQPLEGLGSADVINIVVLRANERQFGLVVDKVNDTEEIVVKPLSRQLKGLAEFAGATIMGDGTIALILDVMGLAAAAGLTGEMREPSLTTALQNEGVSGQRLETLLLADLGDTQRFALPTSMISRLEKMPSAAIEYSDGREVVQYRGTIMPLIRLNEVFGSFPPEDRAQEEFQIVVYADRDRCCGLVVNRILDIVETELQFSTSHDTEDNLLGTAVIQRRVTDVLNLHRIAQRSAVPLPHR